ncbi:MAG: T9SS C-terminal target domain-containing protein, partial [Flavobacteriia bacterium]|nr:T9SS C-terminal target domain-containing protein [Flavobacteriia bacterium]
VINNVPFVPTVSGNYTVSGTGGNGCVGQDVVNVTVNALPNASASFIDPITMVASPAGLSYQWINCTLNENIAGAVDDTLAVTANGSYAVIVTNASGCSDTSDCIIVDKVGLYLPSASVIALYPNPTDGKVTLELPGEEGASAMVYDAQGKLIYEYRQAKNGQQFDLSKLSTGVYTFHIQLNDMHHIEKVVKQ